MNTLRKGQKNQLVTRLQILLNQKLTPSPNLKPDGDFGTKTYDIVKQFQKIKNLILMGLLVIKLGQH